MSDSFDREIEVPKFIRATVLNGTASAIPSGTVVCVLRYSGPIPVVTPFYRGGIVVGIILSELPVDGRAVAVQRGVAPLPSGHSLSVGDIVYVDGSGLTSSPTTAAHMVGRAIEGDKIFVSIDHQTTSPASAGADPEWGAILGVISDQTDLQAELDAKLDVGSTTADVADSSNKRYVTDTQLTVIGNTSGTNTGDNSANSTSNTYADAKISDAAYGAGWDGVTGIAPSKNAVYDKINSIPVGITLADVYPIGSIYTSVVSTNPNTLFGFGTWAAFAAGRVLVGLDSGDTDFDIVEETGGSKTNTPTGTNSAPTFTGSALATHSHGVGTLATDAHAGTAVENHASHTHTYTDVVNHTHGLTSIARQTTGSQSTQHQTLTAAVDNSSTQTAAITDNPSGGVATGTTAGPSATLTHSVTQPNNHKISGSSESVSAGTPSGMVSAPTFTGNSLSVVQPYIVVYMWKRTA
jgi:hypothetical protein